MGLLVVGCAAVRRQVRGLARVTSSTGERRGIALDARAPEPG
jgi:hypothetical protein